MYIYIYMSIMLPLLLIPSWALAIDPFLGVCIVEVLLWKVPPHISHQEGRGRMRLSEVLERE